MRDRERPVVEEPKVKGRDVVWRVSFGRDVMLRWLLLGGGCKQDMMDVQEGWEGSSDAEDEVGSIEEKHDVVEREEKRREKESIRAKQISSEEKLKVAGGLR